MFHQGHTPQTGGLTALGVYVLAGVLFDFAALFEYALLLSMKRIKLARKFRSRLNAIKEGTITWTTDGGANKPMGMVDLENQLIECHIDRLSFAVYLSVALLFNIGYFIIYIYH